MSQIIEGKTQVKIPSRRVVLRGALAVGWGLLLPAALFGCEKKDAGSTGAAPEAPPPGPEAAAPESASATSADSAAPVAKVSKASVQYQTEPKGDQQCSGCLNFIAESNTCKLVEGEISPSGWCTLWAKKT
jgi:hypothetical protein